MHIDSLAGKGYNEKRKKKYNFANYLLKVYQIEGSNNNFENIERD